MDDKPDTRNDESAYRSQHGFDLRFEWAGNGVATLAPICDAIVIVDVLSFTTCVDIAAGNGAFVYAYSWRDASAAAYAESLGALLASHARNAGTAFSLSPQSLLTLSNGAKIVLPSPNGSALSLATGPTPTFAGCLRNAKAIAEFLNGHDSWRTIGVIGAGEKWEDGSLRPALDDLVGAGAIVRQLSGSRSPEAEMAVAAFERFSGGLLETLRACSSGRELIGRGFPEDVELASMLDVSRCVPRLLDGCYRNAAV